MSKKIRPEFDLSGVAPESEGGTWVLHLGRYKWPGEEGFAWLDQGDLLIEKVPAANLPRNLDEARSAVAALGVNKFELDANWNRI